MASSSPPIKRQKTDCSPPSSSQEVKAPTEQSCSKSIERPTSKGIIWLELPGEVRLMIYNSLFESQRVIYYLEHHFMHSGVDWQVSDVWLSQKDLLESMGEAPHVAVKGNKLFARTFGFSGGDANPIAILQTCKDVFREAINCYFAKVTFGFAVLFPALTYTSKQFFANCCKRIEKLEMRRDRLLSLRSVALPNLPRLKEVTIVNDYPMGLGAKICLSPGQSPHAIIDKVYGVDQTTLIWNQLISYTFNLGELQSKLPADATITFRSRYHFQAYYRNDRKRLVWTEEIHQGVVYDEYVGANEYLKRIRYDEEVTSRFMSIRAVNMVAFNLYL